MRTDFYVRRSFDSLTLAQDDKFFIFGFDFTTQFHNVKGGTLPCDLVRDVRAAEIFVRLLLTLPPNLAIIKKLDFKEKEMTCL